jgi:hypothetical protein
MAVSVETMNVMNNLSLKAGPANGDERCAISLVMVSGMFHASWNMLAKNSRDKNAFLWHCQWIGILLFIPWALFDLENASFTAESILLLIGSAVILGDYVPLF